MKDAYERRIQYFTDEYRTDKLDRNMQLINPRRPYTTMVTVLGLSVLIATLLFLQVNEARLSIMKQNNPRW